LSRTLTNRLRATRRRSRTVDVSLIYTRAIGLAGEYLLRVFVDVDRTPAEVVTVYRTSKIEKYRSQP
jgi:hypothetical protein